MMPNIDLRTLNARTYETADMLAASGVSLPRFKQWSLRGIDFSETPAPGKGKRRIFRLYAAYAYATIVSLCDEACSARGSTWRGASAPGASCRCTGSRGTAGRSRAP